MKKKLIFLSILLLVSIGFWQCNKDDETASVSRVVKVSYPDIKLKGDSVIFLDLGQAYADPGATLTDDISGAQSDIQPAGDPEIDVNTPGGYLVTYTASNANGFETTVYRLVIVRPAADAALDLTGTYARSTNGVEFTMTKVDRGVYVCSNVGGVPPPSDAILPVYVIQTADTEIDVPLQPVPNGYGLLECTGETASDTQISWIVRNPGFGTARRTYIKQ